jgi:hypothetical protein
MIQALDPKMCYGDPKNFDGIEFMYALSTVTLPFSFFSQLLDSSTLLVRSFTDDFRAQARYSRQYQR